MGVITIALSIRGRVRCVPILNDGNVGLFVPVHTNNYVWSHTNTLQNGHTLQSEKDKALQEATT